MGNPRFFPTTRLEDLGDCERLSRIQILRMTATV